MRAACSQIIDSIGELSIHDTQPRGLTPEEIKLRHIGNCMKADPAYGDGVAKALGISMSEVPNKA